MILRLGRLSKLSAEVGDGGGTHRMSAQHECRWGVSLRAARVDLRRLHYLFRQLVKDLCNPSRGFGAARREARSERVVRRLQARLCSGGALSIPLASLGSTSAVAGICALFLTHLHSINIIPWVLAHSSPSARVTARGSLSILLPTSSRMACPAVPVGAYTSTSFSHTSSDSKVSGRVTS